jgi:HlyD family secretion protein
MKKFSGLVLLNIAVVPIGYFYVKPKLASKKLDYTFTSLQKGNIEYGVWFYRDCLWNCREYNYL